MRTALLVLLLLLPLASAQTGSGGVVYTSADPATLEVDPQAPQTVTVHAEGEIECLPGTPAPADVVVQPNPAASRGTIGGHEETYYAFEPEFLELRWQEDGSRPGRYTVEGDFTVTVVSDAYRPFPGEVEISWLGFGGDPEDGASECNPDGYLWVAEPEQNLTLTLRSGPPLPDSSRTGTSDGSETTPLPTLLPLVALAVVAALRRRE